MTPNPERVNSIVSDSHFEFSKITTSSTYTTTECGTNVSTGQELPSQSSQELEVPSSSGPKNLPFKLQRGLPFDHLNQGTHVLMDTLKHTGYSLLHSRYLGGMLGAHRTGGPSGAPPPPPHASCDQTIASSTAEKSDVLHVTAGKISKTEASRMSLLFGRALPGGVSGALTQLRQNGLL